jgi:hypothetical protein
MFLCKVVRTLMLGMQEKRYLPYAVVVVDLHQHLHPPDAI